jgi:hypothetical protein
MSDVNHLEADKETFNMATASKSLGSDSTSLVDLKAEVFRKQQEALYNKIHGRNKANNKNDNKKNNIWSKSNVGVLKRSSERAEEERKERMRIQASLEQKAAIYDKLQNGQYKDKDGVFLVNFDKKEAANQYDDNDVEDPEAGGDDEWVEYVDALGRSRMCPKSELDTMKQRDKQSFGEAGQAGKNIEAEASMLSEDMRRELLRQKWEEEEEENLRKTQIHYRDVLFDEARTHSAAFYNFSRNESDRVSQLENLDSLHKETVQARAKKDCVKGKRDAAMAARLKKVRDRYVSIAHETICSVLTQPLATL